MTKVEKKMVEKNLDLIFEFEKYILEHPTLVKKIPRNAVIAIRVDGDEAFNRWSQRLAAKHRGTRRPVFHITIKKMRPARSRIEVLEVERAA